MLTVTKCYNFAVCEDCRRSLLAGQPGSIIQTRGLNSQSLLDNWFSFVLLRPNGLLKAH